MMYLVNNFYVIHNLQNFNLRELRGNAFLIKIKRHISQIVAAQNFTFRKLKF